MPLIQDYNKLFEHTDNIKKIILNGNVVWPTEKPTGPDYTEPFYVENITNETETLNIVKTYESAPTLTIEYSTDKSQWTPFENQTSTTALTKSLAPGDKVYLRCNANTWGVKFYGNCIHGVSKVGGNIMSLLYGSNFTGQETGFPSGSTNNFTALFYYNFRLISASELLLPATTLNERCYFSMFQRCESLTITPELPATTLANYCYSGMFGFCTSLTQTPTLSVTTLTQNCYPSMFLGCTSLNKVTCYATSGINENGSTTNWLSNVASTGTFYKKAGVTWPAGTSGIPSGWTVVEV